MKVFNFPYHTFSTNRADTPPNIGNLSFNPRAGKTRIFTLRFNGMVYEGMEENNILELEKFYREHRFHKSFVYYNPKHGPIVCRFAAPFTIVESRVNSTGITETVEIKLVELYKHIEANQGDMENYIWAAKSNGDYLITNSQERIVWK